MPQFPEDWVRAESLRSASDPFMGCASWPRLNCKAYRFVPSTIRTKYSWQGIATD